MYSRASLISSLLNVVSPSSSRILIRSWIIEIFHPASGGAGKNCFFRTETSEKGREGSIAQSKLMLRTFAPVTLLQSFLTMLYTSRTAAFGDPSSFLVNDMKALNIVFFRCSIPLSGSIKYRCVLRSSRNILLIDTFQVLKTILASLPYRSHSTDP